MLIKRHKEAIQTLGEEISTLKIKWMALDVYVAALAARKWHDVHFCFYTTSVQHTVERRRDLMLPVQ